MAGKLLIWQAGVSAALAGHGRPFFERTDQDQLGRWAGAFDGRDRPANPDAHGLHIRDDQIGEEPSGLLPQAPQIV